MQKTIKLPNGLSLDVITTPELLNRISDHFNLNSPSEVEDDHIVRFIYGAVDNAVDKAEKDLKNPSLK
tara:strand:+ start:4101 stop:4304 length:204 start_codon:yes stop_codon:yes gene_type:complete